MTADHSPLSNPLHIPDVAGPVTVKSGIFGPSFFLNGVKVPRKGKTISFTGVHGQPVEAQIRPGIQPNPTIRVNGQDYPTGPQHPIWQLIVGYLPVMLVLGGLVGAAIGCMGIFVNYRIMRSTLTSGPKGVALFATTVLTLLIGFVVIGTASVLLRQ